MIDQKIHILSNLHNQIPTNEEQKTLGTRRTTFFFFTADVRFTRSEIYAKVIEKLNSNHLAYKQLKALKLTELGVSSDDNGFERMDGYLSEIKQAILSNDSNLLGEDYHDNKMSSLISNLRNRVNENNENQKNADKIARELQKETVRIAEVNQKLAQFSELASRGCNTLKTWYLGGDLGKEIDYLHALVGYIWETKLQPPSAHNITDSLKIKFQQPSVRSITDSLRSMENVNDDIAKKLKESGTLYNLINHLSDYFIKLFDEAYNDKNSDIKCINYHVCASILQNLKEAKNEIDSIKSDLEAVQIPVIKSDSRKETKSESTIRSNVGYTKKLPKLPENPSLRDVLKYSLSLNMIDKSHKDLLNKIHDLIFNKLKRALHSDKNLDKQKLATELFKKYCTDMNNSTLKKQLGRLTNLLNNIGTLENDYKELKGEDLDIDFSSLPKIISDLENKN